MLDFFNHQPPLQHSSEDMITCDINDREGFINIGNFHNCDIVNPVFDDNKIHFIYLFLPKNNENWYFAFKPVLNKSGRTVSIVYELGGNADCELAAMALSHLFRTTLRKCHTPVFDVPEYEEIINHFEESRNPVLFNTDWACW